MNQQDIQLDSRVRRQQAADYRAQLRLAQSRAMAEGIVIGVAISAIVATLVTLSRVLS